MKLRAFSAFLLCVLASFTFAQDHVVPLWPDKIPNQKPSAEVESSDSSNIVRISKVQNPTLQVYMPAKRSATGQAVIICPGGGYRILAYDWEGTDVAKALNAKGITGIVLKYRLPSPESSVVPHETPLLDAQQAIRLVRKNAASWNIDPKKVGIMGFSAGGHLASTAGTHFDETSRPDFMILIYPVISMDKSFTHLGSRENLLGKNPDPELVKLYSNELQVTADTPPTFIVHASDDGGVPVEHSLRMYRALQKKEVTVEMHIYPKGGHGFGLGLEHGYLATWPDRLFDWLERGFTE